MRFDVRGVDHLSVAAFWLVLRHSTAKAPQCFTFVQRYVIGFVTLDLVLRVILARMMDVTFVVHVLRMDSHDAATDPASFGIPTHMIANCECPGQDDLLRRMQMCRRCESVHSTA